LNNNLWASNTAIYDFGRPNASLTYSITNDVYLENIDQPGVSIYTSMDGWGIRSFQQYNAYTTNFAAGSVTISNNIFANSLATNYNGFAVGIMGAQAFPMPAPIKFLNNIVYMWNYGPGGMAGLHSPIWHQTNGGSGSVLTPNQVYLGPSNQYNTVADPTIFPNPTASIETYSGTIGLTATLDGFLTAARAQSKDTWNPALAAAAVNNYVRAGFGMSSSTTSTSSTGTTSTGTTRTGTTSTGTTSTGTTSTGTTSTVTEPDLA